VRASLVEPQTLGRRDAARFCGVSLATWDRHTAAGKVPRPIRLGGRVLWRRGELQAWLDAGCPDRRQWDVMRAAA